MMLNTSSHWTCSPSWRTTTKRSQRVCARRTTCATNIVTSRRQVSSKYGSMKPSVARGSCSKPRAGETDLRVSRTRWTTESLGCGDLSPPLITDLSADSKLTGSFGLNAKQESQDQEKTKMNNGKLNGKIAVITGA